MEKDKKSPLESHLKNRPAAKLYNYFDDLIVSDKFKRTKEFLRKKYLIEDKKTCELSFNIPRIETGEPDIEKVMARSWNEIAVPYFREISVFCDKNGLNFLDFGNIIDALVRNVPIPNDFKINTKSNNLVYLEEVSDIKNNSFGSNDIETHPISIRVSPYAVCGDIVDYVNKAYSPIIKPLQVKYRRNGVKIGSRNKKPKKEITAFVIKKRFIEKLTLKKISELANDKFGTTYNYINISNLIAAEQHRRKNM